MKKIIPFLVIVLVVFGVVYFFNSKKVDVVVPAPAPVTAQVPIGANVNSRNLCFYGDSKTKNNLHDVSWAKLNITGDNVTGEFNYLPAEKDKKIGKFEGKVGAVDKVAMARTADVMWKSMAEGMTVTEQLKIVFGEGTAQANFGEMVDRGDGVYVYKDESKLSFGQIMSDVDCASLSDKTIANNTTNISTNDKYIHPLKWPPIVIVSNSKFSCKTILVNGYCITKTTEGAAGSIFTTYTYAKEYGNKTASINFTIQSVQCLNYDEPNRSECKEKQEKYDFSVEIDNLFNKLK